LTPTESSLQSTSASHSPAKDLWFGHTGKSDIWTGLCAPHVWMTLGWHDIRQRYRRSVLGPFWFTLSTLVLVGALGYLYSSFFNKPIHAYLPYLGVGMVAWQYISTCVHEGSSVFISAGAMIKQFRIPLTTHVMRMAWRNLIILIHSLPVLFAMILFLGHRPGWEMFLVLPGLLLLFANSIWLSIVLGILCTRYRDMLQIVNNLLQVLYFMTPVMWTTDLLKNRAWVAQYNPLHHLIEIVRAPLIGEIPDISSWVWSVALLIVGTLLAQGMMVRYRNRVPYWI
jgi:lipopolysaccharide transport system permease protein